MKNYTVLKDQCTGTVENAGQRQPLRPRNDLRDHSPDGFSYGYGGSGPAQLALALLADATGSDAIACSLYQQFKWHIVAAANRDEDFTINQKDILAWIELVGAVA